MKRYSRHKALVIERQYREQQELEEAEEAEETAEQVEGSAAVDGAQSEQVEDVNPAGAPTTQFDRMLELAAVVERLIRYEKRAWSRRRKAIRAFMAIKLTRPYQTGAS